MDNYKPHVRISIELGRYQGERAYTFVHPIDTIAAHEASQPIDFPGPTAGPVDRMLCTPPDVVNRIMAHRERFIHQLSGYIAKAFIDGLGAQDTEMGYPKEKK